MSDANVRIEGELKDKVKDLLGGKNPTPARLAELLDELELRRNLDQRDLGARPEGSALPSNQIPETVVNVPPAPDPARLPQFAAPILEVAAAERADGDDDFDDLEHEDTAAGTALPADVEREEIAAGAPVPMDPNERLIQVLTNQNAMMLKMFAGFEQRFEELSRRNSVADKAAAAETGKLPPAVDGPPLGFGMEGDKTGPGTWPRGQWFNSPLGPANIQVKLCNCDVCKGVTQHHWFCVICHGGPHHYPVKCAQHSDPQRGPFFSKHHYAPGNVWGISHSVCGKVCHDQYLGMLGVVSGINDATPPGMPGRPDAGNPQAEPTRPAMAMTSD